MKRPGVPYAVAKLVGDIIAEFLMGYGPGRSARISMCWARADTDPVQSSFPVLLPHEEPEQPIITAMGTIPRLQFIATSLTLIFVRSNLPGRGHVINIANGERPQ